MSQEHIDKMPTCPICDGIEFSTVAEGVRDFEYLSPGVYTWLQCNACGFIRIDPLPSPDILAQAYPGNYHSFQIPTSRLTQILIESSRKRQARAISQKLKPHAKVLDIGCSTGDLLQEIGALGNFDLYGIEYSAEVAEVARGKGINTMAGSFEDIELPDVDFDLVSMQHVLEHVTDPRLSLAKSFQILNKGGQLIGELPNYDSWDARLFGRYWGGGHAPRHIWHFTPKTLKRALEQEGFSSVRVYAALHTGHWACSIQNFLRRNRFDDAGLTNGRTWYYPLLLLAFVPVNALQMLLLKTGTMRFECRKP